MKIGEVWESKHHLLHEIKSFTDRYGHALVRVKITNIYQSDELVNPGSVAKDKTYVSSVYVSPWDDGSHHADLSREHFLEQYFKVDWNNIIR